MSLISILSAATVLASTPPTWEYVGTAPSGQIWTAKYRGEGENKFGKGKIVHIATLDEEQSEWEVSKYLLICDRWAVSYWYFDQQVPHSDQRNMWFSADSVMPNTMMDRVLEMYCREE